MISDAGLNHGFAVAMSVAGGVAVLLLFLKIIFSLVRRKLAHLVQERFGKSEILGAATDANFFGLASGGGWQIRGNGALVLTREALYFIRLLPSREFCIPVDTITQVSLPDSFNGKSILSPLLRVDFTENSRQDAIGWAVRHPQRWKASIDALIY